VTADRHEARVLEREGARAIRHYLVLWFGTPVFFVLVVLTLSGVVDRFQTSRPVAALALLIVGGLLSWVLGRWLLRVTRK
jgi:predicted permease